MRIKSSLAAILIVAGYSLASVSQVSAADAPKTNRPDIYDESLDGSKQIADALVVAKKENKKILIQFGANWCGWCHKLHALFKNDKEIAAQLNDHYVLVLVDVNKGHNQDLVKKYGAEKLGLPSLVVLDLTGKHLTTKNTGEFEEGDHHSPVKVIAFLKDWKDRS